VGGSRIDLRYVDVRGASPDWDRSEVIFTYLMPREAAERLADQFRAAIARGAKVVAHWPEPALRQWDWKQDERLLEAAVEYWSLGGAENIARGLAFLYAKVAGRPGITVEPPEATVQTGIYYPGAGRPFTALEDYLAWRRSRGASPVGARGRCCLLPKPALKARDTAPISDALIRRDRENGHGPGRPASAGRRHGEPLLWLDGKAGRSRSPSR
jgi:cobalamin biosynthesis Mg chelatase CobN